MFIGDLAVAEFGSAISRLVRMKQLTPEEAGDKLSDFDRWRFEVARPVEVIPSDVRVAGQFVRKPMPRLMTADAIHLATCQRLGLTLVAHDTDLIDIARLNGIDVIQPE